MSTPPTRWARWFGSRYWHCIVTVAPAFTCSADARENSSEVAVGVDRAGCTVTCTRFVACSRPCAVSARARIWSSSESS
jgi:hypothetical protein